MPESLFSVMMYSLKELWISLIVLMFYIPSSGWGIYRNWPSSIGMATRIRMVNTKAPIAQIPAVIKISTQEGAYSTISPKGEGMNPGMINPIPFSIQIARNNRPHTGKSRFSGVLSGQALELGLLSNSWSWLGQHMSRYDGLLLFCATMVLLMTVTLGLIPSFIKKTPASWIPHNQ